MADLRKAARGRECQVRIPGVCNGNPETTVLAHIRIAGLCGTGIKPPDLIAAKCSNVYRHGSVVYWADEWKAKEDELLKSCQRAYQAATERSADIVYDSIGVGASAGAKFSEINEDRRRENPYSRPINYQRFNAGAGVNEPDSEYNGIPNKDFFANLKAQAWWLVADRFRNTFNAVKNGEEYLSNRRADQTGCCRLY